MWSLESSKAWARLVAACGLAALAAGCFQPLYADRSASGEVPMARALAAVEVMPIDAPPATELARLAVEVRNELTYALSGGGAPLPPTHRLTINLRRTGSALIVDPRTARSEFETIRLDATYQLTEIATGRMVVNGAANTQSSYDVPGQQQRYGRVRGRIDSQSDAARVLAEQIRNRLASYMAAGT